MHYSAYNVYTYDRWILFGLKVAKTFHMENKTTTHNASVSLKTFDAERLATVSWCIQKRSVLSVNIAHRKIIERIAGWYYFVVSVFIRLAFWTDYTYPKTHKQIDSKFQTATIALFLVNFIILFFYWKWTHIGPLKKYCASSCFRFGCEKLFIVIVHAKRARKFSLKWNCIYLLCKLPRRYYIELGNSSSFFSM